MAITKPIEQNAHVQALTKALNRRNTPPHARREFQAIIAQVGKMESQFEAMAAELAAMREQLAQAEANRNPLRNAMRSIVSATQEKINGLRESLQQLRQNIVGGCKNALKAVKEQGIVALNGTAKFFKISPLLERMQTNLDQNTAYHNKQIAKIENFATEYHETGLHLKNMGRAMVGKDALTEAKANGKIAGAFVASHRREIAFNDKVKSCVGRMQSSLGRLEARATEISSVRSIKQDLKQYDKIAKAQKSVPVPSTPAVDAR